MKIAVLGDLHLGFKFGTELEEDSFRNAKRAFELAIQNGAELIILLGDIFHDKIPKPEVMSRSISLFSWLKSQIVNPVLTIYGTHEMRNEGNVNPVQLLSSAGLIRYLHKESIQVDHVVIHGLSGVPDLFARNELSSWGVRPVAGEVNFLLLHQTFEEMIPVKGNVLKYTDLPSGFDAYLCGHIHWRQEEHHPVTGAPILFAGSTVVTQMKKAESLQEKGLYIFETRDRNFIGKKFIPIETRPFFYLEYNATGKNPEQVTQEVDVLIQSKLTAAKPLIFVKIGGRLAEGYNPTDLQFSSLKKKYAENCFLTIEKGDVTSRELELQKGMLSNLKETQASIEEVGLFILSKTLGSDPKQVKEIFDKLAEEDLEGAEKLLDI